MLEAAINYFLGVVWVGWSVVTLLIGAVGGCRRLRLRAGFTERSYMARRVPVLLSVM